MDPASITTSELLVMLDITRRLSEQRMLDPLMEYIATTIFEIIPAERCMIALFAEERTLDVRIARTRQGAPLSAANDQVSHSILERVRRTMTPIVLSDALSDRTLQDARSVRNLGLRSVMCAPLISYGQVIGVIYVENRSSRAQFREESLFPLVLFSNQVVVAIENARIYESLEARIAERTQTLQEANAKLTLLADELREQSVRDSLTGLYNRRFFNETLPAQFEQARSAQQPLAIAGIDVDNFKQINDTFLHEGGDQVLRALAQIIQGQTRATDLIARIGGEEFALIMPGVALPDAIATCERLCAIIQRHDWGAIAPGLQVTASIGVAAAQECADVAALMRRADARLYRAKRLGKNRVVTSDGA
jgi:diguanylate cyclase (GGDEF)-like protein